MRRSASKRCFFAGSCANSTAASRPGAAHLGDVGPIRELTAQPLQEVGADARRVLRELLALDDVQVGERRRRADRVPRERIAVRELPVGVRALLQHLPHLVSRRARQRAADSRW